MNLSLRTGQLSSPPIRAGVRIRLFGTRQFAANVFKFLYITPCVFEK